MHHVIGLEVTEQVTDLDWKHVPSVSKQMNEFMTVCVQYLWY